MGSIFDSGSQKQTTGETRSSEPWAAAQPALKKALSGAEALYDKGSGHNVYDQSLVVPYAQDTLQGMQGIKNSADAYTGALQEPMNQQLDILNQGGYNPYQQTAMGRTDALAGGSGFNAQTGQATETMQNLDTQMREGGGLTQYQQDAMARSQGLAQGNEVMGTNPGFMRNLAEAQKAAGSAANEMAMKTGRYNSPAHQDTLSGNVADVTAKMYTDEYRQQLGRQDAARGQQFGMSQQGIGNQQQTAQGLAQLGQTGYSNIQDANRDLFDSGQIGLGNLQTAAGNIPTAYNALQQPYRDYMGLGQMNEDLNQRQMQDDLRRFREADNAEWDRVAKLNAIAGGAGQMGSSMQSKVTGASASPFQQIAGVGLQGLSSALGGLF